MLGSTFETSQDIQLSMQHEKVRWAVESGSSGVIHHVLGTAELPMVPGTSSVCVFEIPKATAVHRNAHRVLHNAISTLGGLTYQDALVKAVHTAPDHCRLHTRACCQTCAARKRSKHHAYSAFPRRLALLHTAHTVLRVRTTRQAPCEASCQHRPC